VSGETAPEYRKTLFAVRYVLPSALIVAGLVAIVVEPTGSTLHGGLGLIGAGLAAFFFAFLSKLSMTGDKDRDREEAARHYFDEHGRWPDD
jgi:uncharacterized membrane protein